MWFDGLLRARSLSARDVSDLRFFGVSGALVPSDDEGGARAGAAAVRAGWRETAAAARRLRRAGLAAYAALGIHPRRIPARGLEALLVELPDALDRPEVAALGAIGLHDGTPLEERVLVRQLELARELHRPVVVTVPARGRERITRRALALLRDAGIEPGQALVAADERTVRVVRACGHLACLMLSDGAERDGVDEAVRIVAALGPEGLVLGSGAGLSGGDLLALPRAADRLARAGLSVAVVRRVCAANVVALLRADPQAVAAREARGRSGRRASR